MQPQYTPFPKNSQLIDIVGKRFGRLVVLGYFGKDEKSVHRWDCLCDCGNKKSVAGGDLRKGAIRSCGCFRVESQRAAKLVDLTGQCFGRLVAIRHIKGQSWLCKCDCGNEHTTSSARLKRGDCQSCGCLQRELVAERSKTHGMRHTPEYGVWTQMIQRCHKETNKDYHKYGVRGITVCDRWRHSFENFYADMGPRPSDEHSLDRTDNDKGYSPDNCRWTDDKTQANNRRSTTKIEFNGEIKTLSEWSHATGIDVATLHHRLNRAQWTVEAALTTPTPKAQ